MNDIAGRFGMVTGGGVAAALRRAVLLALVPILLAGCTTVRPPAAVPRGDAAYEVIPATDATVLAANPIVAPYDVVDVTVFQEPDLSVKAVAIDAAGNLTLPLIGAVPAANRDTAQLAHEIETRLGAQFLQHPRVSVNITGSPSRTVTVQGQVTQPGVYEMRARTTLLDALAMAQGVTRTAKLSEVVVFRDIKGVRNAAVFDAAQIESGRMPNPTLQQQDIVVVGFSAIRSGWREFLSAVPLIAIFRPFGI